MVNEGMGKVDEKRIVLVSPNKGDGLFGKQAAEISLFLHGIDGIDDFVLADNRQGQTATSQC